MWIQCKTEEENKSGNVGNSHVKIVTEATLWILPNTHISLTHLVECKRYSFVSSDCVDETNMLKGVQWTVWLRGKSVKQYLAISFFFYIIKLFMSLACTNSITRKVLSVSGMPFVGTLTHVIWPRDGSRFCFDSYLASQCFQWVATLSGFLCLSFSIFWWWECRKQDFYRSSSIS